MSRRLESERQPSPGERVDQATYTALARFRYHLRLFHRFSEDAARTAGLTPSQHQLMLAVKGWWGPEPPTIGDAAELLQLKHHSTVELAQRTVAAGMVEYADDPADGRRKRLVLTADGEHKLHDLSLLHRTELRRFRDELVDAFGSG